MGTIVQDYGPIYGEAVNGTVSGRPNGSVYVPLSNKIEFIGDGPFTINWGVGKPNYLYITPAIKCVAEAQDLASYIRTTVYEDSDLTTAFTSPRLFSAGQFNIDHVAVIGLKIEDNELVDEQTYYLVAELINNGEAIATSEVVEVVGAVS